MSTVILAEKPDQARAYMKALDIPFTGKATIGSGPTFLDDKTVVVSAAGHLIELVEPEVYDNAYKDRHNLAILPLIPAKFQYAIMKDKQWLFSQIKKEVDAASRIIVATDKDDEGGAIAFNILRLSRALKYKKIERAYPSALDKQAIVRQFKNLEPIDSTWGQAQAGIARSRSDWLIGINLSRLYTGKLQSIGINGNYAIGRAISTTLNLICQWYEEIANFKEEPIYELRGNTQIGGDDVELRSTIRVVGQEGHDAKQEYLSLLHKNGLTRKHVTGRVVTVNSQPKQQQPPLMMTKGDLYKEMTRVAGWTQQRSKKVMQQNYEQGYQTYPRTDSGKITRHMYDYLGELFDDYLNAINLPGKFSKYSYDDKQFRRYLTTEKSAGAHLGIIPTEKLMTPEADVTDDQRLMWEVVVRKALTLWVNPYTYVSNRLGVQITDTLGMVAQNSVMTYEGWHKILLPSRKGKKKKKVLKQVLILVSI